MRSIISLFLMVLLMGCSKTVYVPLCPSNIEYTNASQQALASELQSIPKDSQIVRYLADYGKQRAMITACRQASKGN